MALDRGIHDRFPPNRPRNPFDGDSNSDISTNKVNYVDERTSPRTPPVPVPLIVPHTQGHKGYLGRVDREGPQNQNVELPRVNPPENPDPDPDPDPDPEPQRDDNSTSDDNDDEPMPQENKSNVRHSVNVERGVAL